ncbi:MAG: sigma-70 family RNA polymerase sigma factor [Leptospirales bacterium]|jgi:RNA polymerase sigma factor (sigma-70 family)
MNSIYTQETARARPRRKSAPPAAGGRERTRDRSRRTTRLISRALSANPRHRQRAAAGLVRLHQNRARAYARAILKDADLAEDAVQEAWLEGFRNLKTLREPGAFPFWFRRLVFKHCDRIRRRADFGEVPGVLDDIEAAGDRDGWLRKKRAAADPAKLIADELERRELRGRLLATYRNLSRADRRLVRLRFIEERPLKEIARELRITTDTIKNRIRILRRTLRPTIQSDAAFGLPAHYRALSSAHLAGVYARPNYIRKDAAIRILPAIHGDPAGPAPSALPAIATGMRADSPREDAQNRQRRPDRQIERALAIHTSQDDAATNQDGESALDLRRRSIA